MTDKIEGLTNAETKQTAEDLFNALSLRTLVELSKEQLFLQTEETTKSAVEAALYDTASKVLLDWRDFAEDNGENWKSTLWYAMAPFWPGFPEEVILSDEGEVIVDGEKLSAYFLGKVAHNLTGY